MLIATLACVYSESSFDPFLLANLLSLLFKLEDKGYGLKHVDQYCVNSEYPV